MGFNLESLEGTVPAGSIDSSEIADGSIVNADVNASAAIAGTKIDPDFGGQLITTTIPAAGNVQALTIVQNDTTNNPIAASIANTGTGAGVFIDQDGTGGIALDIDSEATIVNAIRSIGANDASDGDETDRYAHYLTNTAAGGVLIIDQNVSGANQTLLRINQRHASASVSVGYIRNYGTGVTLTLRTEGDANSLYIDNNGSSTGIKLDGCTGSSTKNPTTDAPVGFVKMNIDNTDRYLPYYAAS